jgi:integrase
MVASRYGTLAKASGATTATNVWRALHAFLVWGMRHGYLDRNPAIGVERRPVRARDRVLSADEIRAVWAATEGEGDFNEICRLLLLSGCRLNEIARLRWDEVLSDRIVIPRTRTKNGHAHTIPLLPAMRSILAGRERHGEYVFGRTDRGFSGASGSKAALDKRLEKAAGVELKPWVLHDLRRTFATGLGELGIPPHIIEACLNHRTFKTGVAGTYNRAVLEAPMRHAWATWETHLRDIIEGRVAGDRVVAFRA